ESPPFWHAIPSGKWIIGRFYVSQVLLLLCEDESDPKGEQLCNWIHVWIVKRLNEEPFVTAFNGISKGWSEVIDVLESYSIDKPTVWVCFGRLLALLITDAQTSSIIAICKRDFEKAKGLNKLWSEVISHLPA